MHRKENEYRTVCPFDCPDSCGIIATVIDGKVTSVRGDEEHARTKGYLCRKMKHYEEMINHPDRILYPMRRIGTKGEGVFEQISWEEAIADITGRWKKVIEEFGAEAILPYSYKGTEGVVHSNCGQAFFHYMGASKLKRTICSSGKVAGWQAIMGDTLGMPSSCLAECDRILVWGSNLAATRIHEIPYIQKARKNGAKVTLIDVYKSPAAAYCDDVILIKPGTDGALALCMIHVLENAGLTDKIYLKENVEGYELLQKELHNYTPQWGEKITGIPAQGIIDLAMAYGQAFAPGILLGSGPSRCKNGGMMTRCIAALPVVTGALARGFGVSGIKQTGKWGDLEQITRPDFDRNHSRSINMMQLASALDQNKTADPPVKSLYVYCSNPLAVTTDQTRVMQGLEREDLFTVVHERFMTDTARYADIILPATFSTEVNDIFHGYGYNGLHYSRKISQAQGECRSNWDTFALLAKSLGFEDPYFDMTQEEICEKYLDHHTGQQVDLKEEEWIKVYQGKMVERALSGPMPIKTESGKIMFYNPDVEDSLLSYKESRSEKPYPLHLVAAPSVYTLNSTFSSEKNLTDARGKMTLILSESDARERGIKDGDRIRVSNDLARVIFYADVRPDIAEGVVVAEGVYTKETSVDGKTVNALFHEDLSDLGEATTMNDNYVEVERDIKQVYNPFLPLHEYIPDGVYPLYFRYRGKDKIQLKEIGF